jgi:hypothetical protein
VRRPTLLACGLLAGCGSPPPPTQVARAETTVVIPRPSEAKARSEGEVEVPSGERHADTSSHPGDDTPSYAQPPQQAPPMPNAWAGPTGGPACKALVDCCLVLVRAMNTPGTDPKMCSQMLTFPSVVCSQAMPMMRSEASKRGARCRP